MNLRIRLIQYRHFYASLCETKKILWMILASLAECEKTAETDEALPRAYIHGQETSAHECTHFASLESVPKIPRLAQFDGRRD